MRHRASCALWATTLAMSCIACAAVQVGPSTTTHRLERETVDWLRPSILWVRAGLGEGTAFGCFAAGVACTAKHVTAGQDKVKVQTVDGRSATVSVLNEHPVDDVAILDIRTLGDAVRPLAVSPLDAPPEGVVVCRVGPPPRPTLPPFVRCDPSAGILSEYTKGKDGHTIGRLVHLGLGFKGDSGAPIVDPATRLVVGVHVAEENSVGRGATSSALTDTFEAVRKRHEWLRRCHPTGDPSARGIAYDLGCGATDDERRARLFRGLGRHMLVIGRRAEAHAAFTESIAHAPTDARGWLWRAITFADSHAALEDAAFAFRLEPALRRTEVLLARTTGRGLAGGFELARALRNRVAPPQATLATLVAPRGCASCPDFCAYVQKRPNTFLFAVEGANHPAAQKWLRSLLATGGVEAAGAETLSALDTRARSGCAVPGDRDPVGDRAPVGRSTGAVPPKP